MTNVADSIRDVAASMNVVTHISRSGVYDGETHFNTSVFTPKGDVPEGGFPIVVLGHRITGTTPDCAPSLSPDLLGLAPTVVALLKAGYVVAVPDFQGLGRPSSTTNYDDTYHPYLDSTTAGYNMIDAAQAAHGAEPQTSTSWLAMGIAEGAQAAWAANELAVDYNNFGGELVGSVSVSPISDVNGLADAAQNGTLNDDQKVAFARFVAALHSEYPDGVNLDDYRRGAALKQWNALLGCQSSPTAQQVAAQIPAGDLAPASQDAVTTLQGYLRKSSLPQGPTQAPMLVSYSGTEPLSPAPWTDGALKEACKMGDVITVRQEPQPEPASAATLSWIDDRFKSAPAQNDCDARVGR
ncbi:lipase family protein [Mycolicibacterium farcinogenes]|uniref:Lipase n=1 Tax=Mycolicibacterium farcinogenes TaxID=1802 RepID=A0ACD1FIE3_MYCFR|nr:lipase family protein [Mycolicibacterium farcinogenes]QZH66834.1 lipase [Mycolicibacterium farcinogenes]